MIRYELQNSQHMREVNRQLTLEMSALMNS